MAQSFPSANLVIKCSHTRFYSLCIVHVMYCYQTHTVLFKGRKAQVSLRVQAVWYIWRVGTLFARTLKVPPSPLFVGGRWTCVGWCELVQMPAPPVEKGPVLLTVCVVDKAHTALFLNRSMK